ncbi:Helix-loop-helix DNA-binding protein, partial [Metarhizium brunneum ARSEF 3297]
MDVDWIDMDEAGVAWLGNMGECNSLLVRWPGPVHTYFAFYLSTHVYVSHQDEYSYQPNEAFGSTPNLFNTGDSGAIPCIKEPGSEFGQEMDQFIRLPYPSLVSDLSLNHYQRTSISESSTCSNSNDTSPPEEALPLKPIQEPCGQIHPTQFSNDQRNSSTSTAMDSTETHPTKDRRPRTRRKRAARNTKVDDDDGCFKNSPAAGEKNHRLRGCHNQVEKNYRSRLNNEFQLLLDALADCTSEKDMTSAGFADRGTKNQSKGSTLRLARRRLLALHTENRLLGSELRAIRHAWTEWQMAWSGNNPVTQEY